jgi:broad specificity phosphatase PhoE
MSDSPTGDAPARKSRRPVPGSGVNGSLVFVRHGESTWVAEDRFQGQADPPLSTLGEQQASLIGVRLADPQADPALPLPASDPIGLWHSTLERAAATARAIESAHGSAIPNRADARLMELAQGKWQGLRHAEVTARFGPQLDAWRADPVHHHAPGGESLSDGSKRVADALRDMLAALIRADPLDPATPDPVLGYGAASQDWPWAIVVAHDGILRLALLHLLGVPLESYWSFPFALCAVTIVELRDGRARLRAHNLAEHLVALAKPALAATDRGGAL